MADGWSQSLRVASPVVARGDESNTDVEAKRQADTQKLCDKLCGQFRRLLVRLTKLLAERNQQVATASKLLDSAENIVPRLQLVESKSNLGLLGGFRNLSRRLNQKHMEQLEAIGSNLSVVRLQYHDLAMRLQKLNEEAWNVYETAAQKNPSASVFSSFASASPETQGLVLEASVSDYLQWLEECVDLLCTELHDRTEVLNAYKAHMGQKSLTAMRKSWRELAEVHSGAEVLYNVTRGLGRAPTILESDLTAPLQKPGSKDGHVTEETMGQGS